jgi:hypothetical protein
MNIIEKYNKLIKEAVPLQNGNRVKINPKSGGVIKWA